MNRTKFATAIVLAALHATVSSPKAVRLSRDAGKTPDWMVTPMSSCPRDVYQSPPRLRGAAKDKRAAKKARNKRGRK